MAIDIAEPEKAVPLPTHTIFIQPYREPAEAALICDVYREHKWRFKQFQPCSPRRVVVCQWIKLSKLSNLHLVTGNAFVMTVQLDLHEA